MECERHTLYKGDALFLPCRTVHLAPATDKTFSAHLNFAFNEGEVCYDFSQILDADCSFWLGRGH